MEKYFSKIGRSCFAISLTLISLNYFQAFSSEISIHEDGVKYSHITSLKPVGPGIKINPFVEEGSIEETIQKTWDHEKLKTLDARIVSMVNFNERTLKDGLDSLKSYGLIPQYDNQYDQRLTVALRKPKICGSLISRSNPYTIGATGFVYKVPSKNIFAIFDRDFQTSDFGTFYPTNEHIKKYKSIKDTPQEILQITGVRNGFHHNELNFLSIMDEEEVSITGLLIDDLYMLSNTPVNEYSKNEREMTVKFTLEIAAKYNFPIYATSILQQKGWQSISSEEAKSLYQATLVQ